MATKTKALPPAGEARFLPAGQFLEWYLSFAGSGDRTAAEILDALANEESFEHEVFAVAGQTADDKALYDTHVNRIREARAAVLDAAHAAIIEGLQHNILVAIGHSAPSGRPWALPARAWHVLELDFSIGAARCAGLLFGNVCIIAWRHLNDEQRVKFEKGVAITEQWLDQNEWAARKPTEAPPGATPERPLHVAVDREAGDNLRRGARTKAAAREGGRQKATQRSAENKARWAAWRDEAQEVWRLRPALSVFSVASLMDKDGHGSKHTIRKHIADLKPQQK